MTDAGQPALNIYQRLNEVRRQVKYVQKDKEVAGRYKAVTHDAVTAWARQSLIEHGVLVVPNLVWSRVVTTDQTTKSGTPIIRFEARYSVLFVNCDDNEGVTMDVAAHALDEGDKAPGKALSYATKYALLKVLSIETGEDEESRIQTEVVEPDPEAKRALEKCENKEQVTRVWKSLNEKQRKSVRPIIEELKQKFKEAESGSEN